MHRSAWSVVGLFVTLIGPAEAARAQEPDKVTKEDIVRWSKELSNWGRWGKDDQMGAANLITPAKRKQAAALVQGSKSCARQGDRSCPAIQHCCTEGGFQSLQAAAYRRLRNLQVTGCQAYRTRIRNGYECPNIVKFHYRNTTNAYYSFATYCRWP